MNIHQFHLTAAKRFYTEDTGGNLSGASGAPPEAAPVVYDEHSKVQTDTTNVSGVEGIKAPDFSMLRKKSDDPPKVEAPKVEPEVKKEVPPPKPEETAQQKADRERDEAGRFKKAEDKGETKPDVSGVGKKTPKVEAEVKVEPVKEPSNDRDKDLDELAPPPNAPPKVKVDFNAMRAKIKESRDRAEALAKEKEETAKLAEELKSKAGKLPEETEKEIQDLRAIRAAFLKENDPKFKEEWDGKAKQAETDLISCLERNNLDKESLDKIKAEGIDAWGTPAQWAILKAHCEKTGQDLLWNQLMQLRIQRENVGQQRAARVKEIQGDPQGYFKKQEEEEQARVQQWTDTGRERTIEIVKAHPDLFAEKDIPADANDAQKKAIETHNAGIQTLAKTIQSRISAIYNRDPKAIIDAAMHQERAAHLDKKLAEVQTELEKSKARIEELEGKVAATKKAGKMGHGDTTPVVPAEKREPATSGVGGSVQEAFKSWQPTRRR